MIHCSHIQRKMPNKHEQLNKELKHLKTLKTEFEKELDAARETKDTTRARELKTQLERETAELEEKVNPFERILNLEEQYKSQRDILERTGVIGELSDGELGIKAIDNEEYTFPAYREIAERMKENRETIQTKIEQGFTQLLIVPFGMNLGDLIERYEQIIIEHHRDGKLLATKKDPSDPDEPLELNESEPVWAWSEYKDADVNGDLVYHPKKFSKEHRGRTKEDILKEQGGFTILLLEDLPNIPREGEGKTIEDRPQFETNKTANQYLEELQDNPAYISEVGMTPEDWITYAITHLEQTDQVVDDYQGNGSASLQLGACFSASGRVPSAYWVRDSQRAVLGGDGPENSDFARGIRGAVRV